MEMRLNAGSFSLVMPKTSIGINVGTGSVIQFKVGGAIYFYALAKVLSAGRTGSVVGTYLDTQWFPVNDKNKRKVTIPNMDGMLAQLELNGFVPSAGKVDIKFTLFDKYNEPILTIERVDEPAIGFQAVNFVGRSRLKLIHIEHAPSLKKGTYWQWPPLPPTPRKIK